MLIRLTAAAPIVHLERRMLAGTLFRYGEVGLTSAGPLRVRPGALKFPTDLTAVKLTEEHDRDTDRGHVALVDDNPERIYLAIKVADGPAGDTALTEALDRGPKGRGGLSFDLENTEIVGDELISADVIAIGQVHDPAFNSARIDQIAASTGGTPTLATQPTNGGTMTPEQIARLAALRALATMTDTERAEMAELEAAETAAAAPATPAAAPPAGGATSTPPAGTPTTAVAASIPAVPGGVPTRTNPRARSLRDVVRDLTTALSPGHPTPVQSITAALSDIISSDHTADIEAPAWSGELWSGLQYVPEWTDLFNSGSLTNWEGRGWRFTSKLEIQDYAGDKTAIPSGDVTTEDSTYTAARMAVGVDIDRKFYDFPNEGFVNALLEQVRESWAIKLDAKVRAYVLAQVTPATRSVAISTTNADATITFAAGALTAKDEGAAITGTGIPAATTVLSITNSTTAELSANATATGTPTATVTQQATNLLTAAARASQVLKRRKVGSAGWIVVNDEDLIDLLELTEDDVPAFLNLYGINPSMFRSSPDVPAGTVLAGVKQAAVVRTLPGSPIRVSAQNLANGGVDEAFFGYWAIEEHHTSGIVSVRIAA